MYVVTEYDLLPENIKQDIRLLFSIGVCEAVYQGLIRRAETRSLNQMISQSFLSKNQYVVWCTDDLKHLHIVYKERSVLKWCKVEVPHQN